MNVQGLRLTDGTLWTARTATRMKNLANGLVDPDLKFCSSFTLNDASRLPVAIPPAAVDTRLHIYPGSQGKPSYVIDYFPEHHFDNCIWELETSKVSDLIQAMTKPQARDYENKAFRTLFNA